MTDPDVEKSSVSESTFTFHWPLVITACVCISIGVFAAIGVQALWQLDGDRVTTRTKGRMMHRKTQTMEVILDELVRGNLPAVAETAARMWEIGNTLDWYMPSPIYEANAELFRDSTAGLLEAAQQGDHETAKEFALTLERSCIECHALINAQEAEL